MIIYILIGVLVLIGIGAAVYLVILKKQNKEGGLGPTEQPDLSNSISQQELSPNPPVGDVTPPSQDMGMPNPSVAPEPSQFEVPTMPSSSDGFAGAADVNMPISEAPSENVNEIKTADPIFPAEPQKMPELTPDAPLAPSNDPQPETNPMESEISAPTTPAPDTPIMPDNLSQPQSTSAPEAPATEVPPASDGESPEPPTMQI